MSPSLNSSPVAWQSCPSCSPSRTLTVPSINPGPSMCSRPCTCSAQGIRWPGAISSAWTICHPLTPHGRASSGGCHRCKVARVGVGCMTAASSAICLAGDSRCTAIPGLSDAVVKGGEKNLRRLGNMMDSVSGGQASSCSCRRWSALCRTLPVALGALSDEPACMLGDCSQGIDRMTDKN